MTDPTLADLRECYQLSEDGLDFKRAYCQRGEDFDKFMAARDKAVQDAVYKKVLDELGPTHDLIRKVRDAEQQWRSTYRRGGARSDIRFRADVLAALRAFDNKDT